MFHKCFSLPHRIRLFPGPGFGLDRLVRGRRTLNKLGQFKSKLRVGRMKGGARNGSEVRIDTGDGAAVQSWCAFVCPYEFEKISRI